MHWIDRGGEPARLRQIRERYTPGWVRHYRCGIGGVPSDDRWRDFTSELMDVFNGLCAYCEEVDKGEIDHFRPKWRDPGLVYEWSNWLFACRACNSFKGQKWPDCGYVDPCGDSHKDRPEDFFDFDTLSGHIIPRIGISDSHFAKATSTIADLKLNELHHLKKRLWWLEEVLPAIFRYDSDEDIALLDDFRRRAVSTDAELSSLTRTWLTVQNVPWGNGNSQPISH